MITFLLLSALVALVAGAIASVVGFGLGSILTPLMALAYGTRIAVAAIAIPHIVGNGLRFWALRRYLDRGVLLRFGLASAIGALAGSLLHARVSNPVLTFTFAAVLILTGIVGVTGLAEQFRLPRRAVWMAGGLSGLLGGMVGSQGPIRAAAMLGLGVPKHAFVATATAIALVVDIVRIPIYLLTVATELRPAWRYIAVITLAVIVGTILGWKILEKLPASFFRRIVSAMILVLGLVMLLRAI